MEYMKTKGLIKVLFSYNFLGGIVRKFVFIFLALMITLVPKCVYSLSVSSRSAILMDMESGRVLYEKDKDTPRLIASITKMMTAILAIESNLLDEKVEVGEEVLRMYGSNIYVELGEIMTLRDLVYGLMLRSGNDASVVIAKFVGGNEENFIRMMNEKAKEIGMTNTIFNNPHGLDEETENKSTALDMAKLSSYAYRNNEFRKISKTKKYTTSSNKKSYVWYNRNKLLTLYKNATGGKTGYTPSAGRTLVTTAEKNNLKLTVVTLNDGNEYDTHQTLYDYGFDNYSMYKVLDKKKFNVDDGFYKNKVYIKNDFLYPLTDVEIDNVKVLVKLENKKNYSNKNIVGEVVVTLSDEVIYRDFVYEKEEKEFSLWEKIVRFIRNDK